MPSRKKIIICLFCAVITLYIAGIFYSINMRKAFVRSIHNILMDTNIELKYDMEIPFNFALWKFDINLKAVKISGDTLGMQKADGIEYECETNLINLNHDIIQRNSEIKISPDIQCYIQTINSRHVNRHENDIGANTNSDANRKTKESIGKYSDILRKIVSKNDINNDGDNGANNGANNGVNNGANKENRNLQRIDIQNDYERKGEGRYKGRREDGSEGEDGSGIEAENKNKLPIQIHSANPIIINLHNLQNLSFSNLYNKISNSEGDKGKNSLDNSLGDQVISSNKNSIYYITFKNDDGAIFFRKNQILSWKSIHAKLDGRQILDILQIKYNYYREKIAKQFNQRDIKWSKLSNKQQERRLSRELEDMGFKKNSHEFRHYYKSELFIKSIKVENLEELIQRINAIALDNSNVVSSQLFIKAREIIHIAKGFMPSSDKILDIALHKENIHLNEAQNFKNYFPYFPLRNQKEVKEWSTGVNDPIINEERIFKIKIDKGCSNIEVGSQKLVVEDAHYIIDDFYVVAENYREIILNGSKTLIDRVKSGIGNSAQLQQFLSFVSEDKIRKLTDALDDINICATKSALHRRDARTIDDKNINSGLGNDISKIARMDDASKYLLTFIDEKCSNASNISNRDEKNKLIANKNPFAFILTTNPTGTLINYNIDANKFLSKKIMPIFRGNNHG